MSRKLVIVGVFLAVLPVPMVAARARGDDPPNKAVATPAAQEAGAAVDPFGAGDDALFAGGAAKPVEAKPPSKPKVHLAKPKPHAGPVLHGGEKAILKALKQKTDLDFVETPLQDVLEYLSQKHRIPIRMDSSALKEAGVDDSTQITCKLSGIPLRSALKIMLDEIQLKSVIHNDVLMVTSPMKAESDEYMVTKCYEVSDLLISAKDRELQYPLDPFKNEILDSQTYYPPGSGNGMPITNRMRQAGYDIQQIKDSITNTIATKSWVDNGGTGTMGDHDRMLVISQTQEVHEEIGDFLGQLRARRNAVPILSVELHWLWLDARQRDKLLGGHAKSLQGQLSLAIDRQRLRQIASEAPGFHGQVACVNSQGTTIAAGDRRSTIISAIPVVGGDNAVGYQPIIGVPNVGVTAQVRPTFVPGTQTAMLDVVSIITRWEKTRPPVVVGSAWPAKTRVIAANPAPTALPVQSPAINGPTTAPPPVVPSGSTHSSQGGSGSCPIDLPVVPTQQIGTTLRVPLGKPVIIGSMTFAPAGDAGLGAANEDAVEVYLIATTNIVRGASK